MFSSRTEPKKTSNHILLIFGFMIIVCFVIAALLFISFSKRAKSASDESFATAYSETKQETYDWFYHTAYDYNEEKYHVRNRATISIGNLREENALEVLSVSESWLKVTTEEDVSDSVRWVEFNATGVYTVNLSTSEFIIDDYNHFVIVKLDQPQLGHIALDPKVTIYKNDYKKGIGKVNGNYEQGTTEAMADRREALKNLTNILESRDDDLTLAKKNTEFLLRNLIRNINTELVLTDEEIRIEWI